MTVEEFLRQKLASLNEQLKSPSIFDDTIDEFYIRGKVELCEEMIQLILSGDLI